MQNTLKYTLELIFTVTLIKQLHYCNLIASLEVLLNLNEVK